VDRIVDGASACDRGEGILTVVHDLGLRAQESHDLPARLEIQKEVRVVVAPGAQQEAVARDGAHAI
jgi:hypothetical protein